MRHRWRLLGTTALALGGTLVLTRPALANPQGGSVVAGAATIVQPSANQLNVNQSTDKAIINWSSFSIGSGETTTFIQPSTTSVTLNRVLGTDPSAIDGSLTANGRVFIVNQNGIVFGAGSKVDVAGLVATTADIADADFMAGTYRFNTSSPITGASVTNLGTISIAENGLAALVAPTVANQGIITARLGSVTLGGHATFTLDLAGDGLISFDTGEAAPAASASNNGQILADGGQVRLDAGTAGAVVGGVVDMSGVIQARTVGAKNGQIVLSGSGDVTVEGQVEAPGGSVSISGGYVALGSGASLDGRRRVFILDFVGAGENTDGLQIDLGTSAGKVSNRSLVSNAALHGLRASFEVDPNNADLIEMRLRIMRGDHPVTETWLYRWTSP